MASSALLPPTACMLDGPALPWPRMVQFPLAVLAWFHAGQQRDGMRAAAVNAQDKIGGGGKRAAVRL